MVRIGYRGDGLNISYAIRGDRTRTDLVGSETGSPSVDLERVVVRSLFEQLAMNSFERRNYATQFQRLLHNAGYGDDTVGTMRTQANYLMDMASSTYPLRVLSRRSLSRTGTALFLATQQLEFELGKVNAWTQRDIHMSFIREHKESARALLNDRQIEGTTFPTLSEYVQTLAVLGQPGPSASETSESTGGGTIPLLGYISRLTRFKRG